MHLRQNLGINSCEAWFQLGKYSPDFPVLWNKLGPSLASLCFLALRNIHGSLDFKLSFCNALFMHQWPWKNFTAGFWPLIRLWLQYFLLGKLFPSAINRVPRGYSDLHAGNAQGWAAPSGAGSLLHSPLALDAFFSGSRIMSQAQLGC